MAEDEYESLYEKWKNFDWQDWVDRFGVEIVDAMPEGWRLWEGCLMTPKGYEWIFNGKSILKRGEHQSALLRTGGGHCLRSAKGSPGANEKTAVGGHHHGHGGLPD